MSARRELLAELRGLRFETSESVMLADLELQVHATASRLPALEYFSKAARAPAAPRQAPGAATHRFSWIDPERLTDGQRERASRCADRGFRADRFRSGFYLTHHHAGPALLFREPGETLVIGGDPTKILWSYLVKVLLSDHAWRTGRLHLKAAAIVARSHTMLIVGRGGGGKTFLSLLACQGGATLLANTHVLLSDDAIEGVASSIRLRPHPAFEQLLSTRATASHFESDELVIDAAELQAPTDAIVPTPDLILVADYSEDDDALVERLASHSVAAFVDQFAWPINTYGMKYDVWDFVGGTVDRFAACIDADRGALDRLVSRVPAYRVSWRLEHPSDVDQLLDRLELPHRTERVAMR